MSHLSQAASAQSEVAVITSRSSADSATIVQTNLRVFAFSNKHLALVLFVDHRCFGHVCVLSSFARLLSERHAKFFEQRQRFLIGARRSYHGDVHPSCSVDFVVTNFGEYKLLFNTERVVAATVK